MHTHFNRRVEVLRMHFYVLFSIDRDSANNINPSDVYINAVLNPHIYDRPNGCGWIVIVFNYQYGMVSD